ncbi:ArsR/SmtB family transcription factor [Acidobacteriota bacterium]
MNQEELARLFKALGNENRLKILEAIRSYQSCCPEAISAPEGEDPKACCVDEIGGHCDVAQSTLSQHLKELYNAGLLERHKKAQWVYYTIRQERLQEITEYIDWFASGITEKA